MSTEFVLWLRNMLAEQGYELTPTEIENSIDESIRLKTMPMNQVFKNHEKIEGE